MQIEISQNTFERLQRLATPLVDAPEDVIVKLLDAIERKRKTKMEAEEVIDLSDLLEPNYRPGPRRVSGFSKELWDLVIQPLPQDFGLHDVYRHLEPLRAKRPHIKELEASTRAGLQKLRDAGYLEFLDNRGQYRKLVTSSDIHP